MPQIRASELSTGEVAIFDTDTGELVILPVGTMDKWLATNQTIDAAKILSEDNGGYTIKKTQLKSLLLATDKVVLLT